MEKNIVNTLKKYLDNEKDNFNMQFKLCAGITIFASLLLFNYLMGSMFWFLALLITACIDFGILSVIYVILLLIYDKYLQYVKINNFSYKKGKIVDKYVHEIENGLGTEYYVQLEGENDYRRTYHWVYSKVNKDKNCTIVFYGNEINNDNWVNLVLYEE